MDTSQNACGICFELINIAGFSICNHKICYECCLKVCLFKDPKTCPICRSVMTTVIFTLNLDKSYQHFDLNSFISFKSRDILVENSYVFKILEDLTSYYCSQCDTKFKTLSELSTHLKISHSKFICQICIDSLSLLPKDHVYYTEKELFHHQHNYNNGHPICFLCSKQFYNRDALLSHQRSTHITCSLCPDSYFSDINHLKIHAKSKHQLCQIDFCNKPEIVTMFRTVSELTDHITKEHKTTSTSILFDQNIPSKHFRNRFEEPNHKKQSFSPPRLDDQIAFPGLIESTSRNRSQPPPSDIQITNPKKNKPKKQLNSYDIEFPALSNDIKVIPNNKPSNVPLIKSLQTSSNHSRVVKNPPKPNLLDMVKDLCDHDTSKVDQFMVLSGRFYQGEITAPSYRKSASSIIGRANMDKLIPVLADSLTGKQREALLKTQKPQKYTYEIL